MSSQCAKLSNVRCDRLQPKGEPGLFKQKKKGWMDDLFNIFCFKLPRSEALGPKKHE